MGFCTGSTLVYNLIELLGLHMCLYLMLDLSDLCQAAHFLLSAGYYCQMWVSETQEIFWNVIFFVRKKPIRSGKLFKPQVSMVISILLRAHMF